MMNANVNGQFWSRIDFRSEMIVPVSLLWFPCLTSSDSPNFLHFSSAPALFRKSSLEAPSVGTWDYILDLCILILQLGGLCFFFLRICNFSALVSAVW